METCLTTAANQDHGFTLQGAVRPYWILFLRHAVTSRISDAPACVLQLNQAVLGGAQRAKSLEAGILSSPLSRRKRVGRDRLEAFRRIEKLGIASIRRISRLCNAYTRER